MKSLTIYIAASWRHQHAVEMLTYLLRLEGHEVLSFVENNYGEGYAASGFTDFEQWVLTKQAEKCFKYDTDGASKSDCVIYIGPSGKDAAAELGIAWASGTPIIGLYAKGEDFGLMRRMVKKWCSTFKEAIEHVNVLATSKNSGCACDTELVCAMHPPVEA